MKEIRETIGVQRDCVVNNEELFALKRIGTDNSVVYSRCVEVCSSDGSESQGKGIGCKVLSPIVKLNHELPPFLDTRGCFILKYYILQYLISF